MNESELLKAAHVLDAAWLIALWRAIHGGDPSSEDLVVEENEALDLAAIGLVARLGELCPDAYNDPGATFANLRKLGISMTATLSGGEVVELRGPDDLKHFAMSSSASGFANKLCLQDGIFIRACKRIYKVAG